MSSEVILCSGCGITLRPFMKICPRCGAVRDEATPIVVPLGAEGEASSPAAAASAPDPRPDFFTGAPAAAAQPLSPTPEEVAQAKTEVIPFDVVRLQRNAPLPGKPGADDLFAPPQDVVFLSPNDTVRRFPLLTGAQKTMIAIGIGLLILMSVIAWLLWRQQRREAAQRAGATVTIAQAVPAAAPSVDPSPTPTPIDDAALAQSVRTALMAYSPLGFSRFRFEVKEGIVTVDGEAEHQPEKDGVDNVVKLIVGVRSVVNNLKVRPEQPSSWAAYNGPPVKLNTAEARVLDEAMQRQIRLGEQASGAAGPSANETQREEEKQRREQVAARLREEEAATRRAAEEKLRRETEEYERRQEEMRRAESERRARAEQARLDAGVLRSGTVAWSGTVDGVDEIVIAGGSASVRHLNGVPPRDVKTSFSAPVPRSPVNVKLLSINGRGAIAITQQPSAANGYTTIVRVDDSGKGGDKLYQFTLRWSMP
ncbi:MAG: BON domain-containing protein [Blastocatellia bacterium]|nr:BON domain-containing protein [Blastocatellia bacterium]